MDEQFHCGFRLIRLIPVENIDRKGSLGVLTEYIGSILGSRLQLHYLYGIPCGCGWEMTFFQSVTI
jgi:hypothetical protein